MTINQMMDKLLSKYENKDISNMPAIIKLKQKLIDLKVFWGGNTEIDNVKEVIEIIDSGKDKESN
ncbi:MAG: hypothetical protein KA007_00255 [Candidatus Pacebacteria bacterium]|jgi:hypothetical protein|nr:hypothetical protein [Candidatus Paceibacterota bacterium]